jgi:hypothetical protein
MLIDMRESFHAALLTPFVREAATLHNSHPTSAQEVASCMHRFIRAASQAAKSMPPTSADTGLDKTRLPWIAETAGPDIKARSLGHKWAAALVSREAFTTIAAVAPELSGNPLSDALTLTSTMGPAAHAYLVSNGKTATKLNPTQTNGKPCDGTIPVILVMVWESCRAWVVSEVGAARGTLGRQLDGDAAKADLTKFCDEICMGYVDLNMAVRLLAAKAATEEAVTYGFLKYKTVAEVEAANGRYGRALGEPGFREDLTSALIELERIMGALHHALGADCVLGPTPRFNLSKVPGRTHDAANLRTLMERCKEFSDSNLLRAISFCCSNFATALHNLRHTSLLDPPAPVSLVAQFSERATTLVQHMGEDARITRVNDARGSDPKVAELSQKLIAMQNTIAKLTSAAGGGASRWGPPL